MANHEKQLKGATCPGFGFSIQRVLNIFTVNSKPYLMRVKIPPPMSGGLIMSYKCTAACRHCMYACNPGWDVRTGSLSLTWSGH
jgi:hypothetical protein